MVKSLLSLKGGNLMKKIIKYLGVAFMCIVSQLTQASLSNIDSIKQYDPDVQEILQKSRVLYTKSDIESATERVANEITAKLSDKKPIVLSVLIGGMMYSSTLTEKLNFPLEMDYINVSHYDGEIKGSGNVKYLVEPKKSLKGRNVLIVDDVLDGGITLAKIKEYCKSKGAAEVYTAVMTQKNRQRDTGGLDSADFIAFNTENEFLIGFGLDYKGYLRNLPEIYSVQV